MVNDLEPGRRLAQGLLQLYKQALAAGCGEVADHLLCALEQLAKSRPACEPALDRAYLWGAVMLARAGPDPAPPGAAHAPGQARSADADVPHRPGLPRR